MHKRGIMKFIFVGILAFVSVSASANCKVHLDSQISGYFAPSPGQPSPLPEPQGYSYTESEEDADLSAKIVRSSKENVGIFGLPGSGRQDNVHLILVDSKNTVVSKKELSSCHLTKEDLSFYQGCSFSNPTYARQSLKIINSKVSKMDCSI